MFHVYLMTNKPNGTLFVGVTSDLVRRVQEHRNHDAPGFADRYNLERLVWFEAHERFEAAVQRERNIKHWKRAWKCALIERDNPKWRDLWLDIAPWR